MYTERQKYYLLLGEVCEKLTTDAVEKAIRAGIEAPLGTLNNARIGRNVNLPLLVNMVELSMPDYQIPTHLRPAA
ncbi:hypothetical protein [Hymenobacter pini]|uniref:hypothetical protein n=1 Tax=Hymenobacter pini TaxID=2880879 RepID=UPI001CF1745F|nr:hypothetical protein [Hymenobacter pini]MCA8830566.1 hypothetical protein [Hymenobacter pini]